MIRREELNTWEMLRRLLSCSVQKSVAPLKRRIGSERAVLVPL
jgi:hypothetical protein